MAVKACSFLPAASTIIEQLGLVHQLVGVTFECPVDKPIVVRSRLEGKSHTSEEINQLVAAYTAQGVSLYFIDQDVLVELQPDVIFTQDVCPVCQIDTPMVEAAIAHLPQKPGIVSLLPHHLRDVWNDIQTVAHYMEAPSAGRALIQSIEGRIAQVKARVKGSPRRTMVFLEWPDPLFNCGHWIPDMIQLAGGHDPLANPGGYSTVIDWPMLLAVNPELLILGACGLPMETVQTELVKWQRHPDWPQLQAVQQRQVYIVDGDWFTCPGPALIDGIELLAHLLHPHSNFPALQLDQHFLQVV